MTLVGLILNYSFIGIFTSNVIHILFFVINLLLIFAYLVRYKKWNNDKYISKLKIKNKINLNKVLLLILLIVITIIPFLVLGKIGFTQEFTYRHMAFAKASEDSSHINPYLNSAKGYNFEFVDLYPGHDIFLIILISISEINVINFQFLPLMGIIILLLYYSLSKKLLKSNLIAFVLSIAVISYDLAYSMGIYNTWYYSITYGLYLTFLIILTEKRSPNQIFALFLIFLASFFIHHTVAVWIILAFIIFNLFNFIGNYRNYKSNKKNTLNITLALIVIYIMFNKVIFKQYLPKIGSDMGVDSTYDFMNLIINVFKFSPPILEKYVYSIGMPILQNPVLSFITSLRYLLILIPVGIYFIVFIKKIVQKIIHNSNLRIKENYYIIIIILGTGIIDYGLYAIFGRPSLKYIIFMFPILSIISLKSLFKNSNRRNIIIITFMILLLSFSFIKFGLYLGDNLGMPTTTYENIEPSSNWLNKNEKVNSTLITDMHTFGKFQVLGAYNDKFYDWAYYTSEIYDLLVNEKYKTIQTDKLKRKADYILIDGKNIKRPIISLFWLHFEPINPYLEVLNNNVNLNEVYDDGNILIYDCI